MDMTDPQVKERVAKICAQVHPMMKAYFNGIINGQDGETKQAAMFAACEMGEDVAKILVYTIGMAEEMGHDDPTLRDDPDRLFAQLQEKGTPDPIAREVTREIYSMWVTCKQIADTNVEEKMDGLLDEALAGAGIADPAERAKIHAQVKAQAATAGEAGNGTAPPRPDGKASARDQMRQTLENMARAKGVTDPAAIAAFVEQSLTKMEENLDFDDMDAQGMNLVLPQELFADTPDDDDGMTDEARARDNHAMMRMIAMDHYYMMRGKTDDEARDLVAPVVDPIVGAKRREELFAFYELGVAVVKEQPDAEATSLVNATRQQGVPIHLARHLPGWLQRANKATNDEFQHVRRMRELDEAARQREVEELKTLTGDMLSIADYWIRAQAIKNVSFDAIDAKIAVDFPDLSQNVIHGATDTGFRIMQHLIADDSRDLRTNAPLFGQVLRLEGVHFAVANAAANALPHFVQAVDQVIAAENGTRPPAKPDRRPDETPLDQKEIHPLVGRLIIIAVIVIVGILYKIFGPSH